MSELLGDPPRTKTFVEVERLPEPDESPTTRKSTRLPEADYYENGYGVTIKHADGKGRTVIPWHRIVSVQFRREEVAE